jgi:nucleoside-diphosphate-sugar epimerase
LYIGYEYLSVATTNLYSHTITQALNHQRQKETDMKKALVMGITGGFGGHVAQALVEQGWSLKAFVRDPAKLPAQFSSAEVVSGNAANLDEVRAAAQGVDLMVYAVNPPGYDWENKAIPWLENAAKVAEELGLTVVFPGNVYVFDPADGPDFDENAPIHPISSKGNTRTVMEDRLQQASRNGAQVIIIRAGDFIGDSAASTWIGQLLKPAKGGYALSVTGPVELPHTWAYLPDVAKTVAQLADVKETLSAYNVFHFKGYRTSFAQLAETIQATTGKNVAIKNFPWWILHVISPFSTLFHGLLEMRYLWNKPLNLSDKKLTAVLKNPVPHTPLGEALLNSGVIAKS